MQFFKVMVLSIACVFSSLSAGFYNHRAMSEYTIERDVDKLLMLVQKRLVFMHEVAMTKWLHKLPIEDLARESQMLDAVVAEGEKLGIDRDFVRGFFQAQIKAAKELQTDDFDCFDEYDAEDAEVLNLRSEIRPYLDQINREILEAIAKVFPLIQNKTISPYVLEYPISDRNYDYIRLNIWEMAIAPLQFEQGEEIWGESTGYGSSYTR